MDESGDDADFLPNLCGAMDPNASQHLNEDELLLMKVEEFNMQQAVLRTKLRVKNNREEAIDFIAKVILMVFGLMPLELDFLTSEFRQSYVIYPALSVEQLERLMQEIGDYELILADNRTFREFWAAHRELCKLQLEKKRLGSISEVMSASEDRLFKEDVLEAESNAQLSKMTRRELGDLLDEIRDNIASNASFAAELQYWQGLSRKVRHKMAVKKIESIYRLFLKKNQARID